MSKSTEGAITCHKTYDTSTGRMCKAGLLKYVKIRLTLMMLQEKIHKKRILIGAGSGSGKTNAFFNPINHQQDIDNIFLYARDPYGPKYHMLINKQKNVFTDMISNKKPHPVVTEVFIRGRKLCRGILLVFIIQSYFLVHFTLLHHENSKQTRVSANCLKSFV